MLSQTAKGRRRRDCEREVETFIQNVHHFLRYHREHPEAAPHEHVVVFDEAQRAWDRDQMLRKHDVESSEAEALLDVMERLPDWSVVIALVGGGQEIYLGEAGLEAWGRRSKAGSTGGASSPRPRCFGGGESVSGHRLFEGRPPTALRYREEPLAHLSVGVRNHRARRWAEWVDAFLDLRLDAARDAFPDPCEFPCVVTRDLDDARDWLRAMGGPSPGTGSGSSPRRKTSGCAPTGSKGRARSGSSTRSRSGSSRRPRTSGRATCWKWRRPSSNARVSSWTGRASAGAATSPRARPCSPNGTSVASGAPSGRPSARSTPGRTCATGTGCC